MVVEETELPGVLILTPKRHGDARGFFVESYNKRTLAAAGLAADFVQDNHSCSVQPGTVRGLHFQIAPSAQGKLVRVLRGRILDVAVDLRRGSATYGRHVGVELSAENGRQLWVPAGLAHGFCTTEPNTEVFYKVTEHYAPETERGLLWNDPELAIAWPVAADAAILSDKDRVLPRLADCKELPLSYD
jgi:dTDP-4-dehydrorhamnose 3,5-epimerase